MHKVLAPEKIIVPPKKERRNVTSAEIAKQQDKFNELERAVGPKYAIRTKPLNTNNDDDDEDAFKVPVFKATPFKPTQVIHLTNLIIMA